jgi:hypothetical protein
MKWNDVDWQDLAAFTVVLTFVMGALAWFLRHTMNQHFAARPDHVALVVRVSDVERSLLTTATKADVHGMEARLRPVETGVAVVAAELQGVKQSVNRTEHMVSLLVDHQMGTPKP